MAEMTPEETRAAARAKHSDDLLEIEDDYKTAIDASNAEHAVNVDKANLARDEATQASLAEMHAALEAVDAPPAEEVNTPDGGKKEGLLSKVVGDVKNFVGGNTSQTDGGAAQGDGTQTDGGNVQTDPNAQN